MIGMTRAEDARPWREIRAGVARKLADWPDPEQAPGAAVSEALSATPPKIRR